MLQVLFTFSLIFLVILITVWAFDYLLIASCITGLIFMVWFIFDIRKEIK